MVDPLHLQNESFDILSNGSVVEAAIKSYEIGWTFGGITWFWVVIFLFTLLMVAIKSDSPAMVAMYAILGGIALRSQLPLISDTIFGFIMVITIFIWLFSVFISKKID